MRCVVCGEHTYHSILKERCICQACYQYERNGGIIYPPSPKGVITFNEKGNPICHICGQAHKKLGAHIYWHHQLTVEEYKRLYKLNIAAKLTCLEYREKMKQHVLARPELIRKNLLEAGARTRYKLQDNRCTGHKNKKFKTPVVSLAYADTQPLQPRRCS